MGTVTSKLCKRSHRCQYQKQNSDLKGKTKSYKCTKCGKRWTRTFPQFCCEKCDQNATVCLACADKELCSAWLEKNMSCPCASPKPCDHQLIYSINTETRYYVCDCCGKTFKTNEGNHRCNKDNFDLCWNCLPPRLTDALPFEPHCCNHPGSYEYVFPQRPIHDYSCGICHETAPSRYGKYRCSSCKKILCLKCRWGPLAYRALFRSFSIHHGVKCFLGDQPHMYEIAPDGAPYRCDLCNREKSGTLSHYQCKDHNLDICWNCIPPTTDPCWTACKCRNDKELVFECGFKEADIKRKCDACGTVFSRRKGCFKCNSNPSCEIDICINCKRPTTEDITSENSRDRSTDNEEELKTIERSIATDKEISPSQSVSLARLYVQLFAKTTKKIIAEEEQVLRKPPFDLGHLFDMKEP